MRKLSQLRLLTWYKVDDWCSRIKHLQQHMVILRNVAPVVLPRCVIEKFSTERVVHDIQHMVSVQGRPYADCFWLMYTRV